MEAAIHLPANSQTNCSVEPGQFRGSMEPEKLILVWNAGQSSNCYTLFVVASLHVGNIFEG